VSAIPLCRHSGGKIAAVEGTQAKNFRADEHVMLLSPLAEYIPDVKVYFNVGAFTRSKFSL
jgi:hypothetical protein